MEGAFSFRFLNKHGKICNPADWTAAGQARLWLYNLHYFDDLNAQAAPSREAWHRHLIARWIAENPPGQGNGWEPYPLSLRIVNWIKWALAGNRLEPEWLHSLAVQTRYLQHRLEWHLLGNHLFANAKALVFAGSFFGGAEAEAWLSRGLAILEREIPEQILSDGGHFELSPMYHAIILEDILDLIDLARSYPGAVPEATVGIWVQAVNRMRYWLVAMLHPDGDISFFNDAAFGIAGSHREIEDYARRLGLDASPKPAAGITKLSSSGYLRVAQGQALALLDVARVGPDYLPGHAHADTLSFELSLNGTRVIVNSGTSVYGNGPERLRQRATASHSTVEIDNRNSTEVWGGFRVARRARPYGLILHDNEDGIVIECSHDGYRRFPNRAIHKRKWHFHSRSVSIHDAIKGNYQTAVARFHLHPDVSAEGLGNGGFLTLQSGQNIRWTTTDGTARIRTGTWHPEFGLSIPNIYLEILFTSPSSTTTFSW